MNILALETSAHIGALCLLKRGDAANVHVVSSGVGDIKLSAWVVPAIQRLLHRAQVSPSQINAIAYGMGPGAFTGVRTACAAAQALAYAWKVPLVAVDSLHALAEVVTTAELGIANIVDIVLDARMNELYAASFTRSKGQITQTAPTTLISKDLWQASNESSFVFGSGAALLGRAVDAELIANIESRWAEGVARVAQQKLACGEITDPLNAEPSYVRNNVAETETERAAKRIQNAQKSQHDMPAS